MKRSLIRLFAILLTLVLLGATAFAEAPADVDLSKPVDLFMYLLGDPSPDLDRVLAEINKLAERDLNCTLSIGYIPWSDMDTKYSLILASGEPVDLMFTGDWAYYTQEATKGAFLELTDEMLQKYMAGTWAQWTPAAWNHELLNGKKYAVPNNLAQYTTAAQCVAIRGDLREKYGIEPLKTIQDWENYVITVAQNEDAITACTCTIDNRFVKQVTLYAPNDIVYVPAASDFVYHYREGESFTEDQLEYTYFLPEYVDWAKHMKELADAGVWSRNSASSTLQNQEAFEAGQSATCIQHFKSVLGSVDKINLEHPEWKPEAYNLFPDNIKTQALYSGDAMAIPVASKNPERAMMLLDKLNSDETYYNLMQYGIEGVHWIDEGDGMFSEGPEWGNFRNAGCGQWGMQNQRYWKTSVNENPQLAVFTAEYDAKVVHPICEGFRPDETPVRNEMAAIRAVEEQYGYLIDLGLVDDVDAAYEELKQELERAGIDRVIAEYRRQLGEFLAAVQ